MGRLSSSGRPWQPNLMDVESCSAWHIYLRSIHASSTGVPHRQRRIKGQQHRDQRLIPDCQESDLNRCGPLGRCRKVLRNAFQVYPSCFAVPMSGPDGRWNPGTISTRTDPPPLLWRRSRTACRRLRCGRLSRSDHQPRYARCRIGVSRRYSETHAISGSSLSTTDTPHSAIRIRPLGFLASSRGSGRRSFGDAIAGCSAT